MARKWWTLIAVCTGAFMLLLDITIVNVALPQIQRAFNASLSDLQWTIDAYALTLAAFLLTAGALADRFGRRRLFAIGLAIFTCGSLACGLAGGIVFLVLARAGQGVGGAIMFATALALIAQSFSGRDRAVAFGVFGAITGVAVAVGPVLGGVITTGISWRWIFFVNIPVGLTALLVTLSRVDEWRSPSAARLDLAGFLTFSGGLAGLVFGLIRSAPDGWGSTTVVLSLSAAVLLLLAFVFVEVSRTRADVRSPTPAQTHLRRRTHCRIRHERIPLLRTDLPDPLLPADARLLGRRNRSPLPASDGCDLPRRRDRGAADRACPDPAAHRPRFRPRGRRPAPDARPHGR